MELSTTYFANGAENAQKVEHQEILTPYTSREVDKLIFSSIYVYMMNARKDALSSQLEQEWEI